MSEHLKVNCEWCGKSFIPTPDEFVESGFAAFDENKDEADSWKGEQPVESIDIESIPVSDRERMKKDMGINDDQLKELLTTGVIENGASIICVECQDKALEEQEGEG